MVGLLATLAARCGDDEDDTTGAADAGSDATLAADSRPTLRIDLVTINMALTTTFKGPAQRLPGNVAALEAQDVDMLCLQEDFLGVTTPQEMAALLADTYPHAYESDLPNETAFGTGLLIVSKHPLLNTSALRFTNEDLFGVVDRSLLVAEVEREARNFRVACTHLTAGLGTGGVQRRQAQQQEIFDYLDALPAVDGPTFLLGDFNMGPDPIGACTPSSDPACVDPDIASYDLVLEHFDDPNADLDECTQCKEQFDSLQTLSVFSNEPDQRIDHCFVRNLDPYRHLHSEIVLAEEVAIPFEGETLTHLSDHRGVRCEFGE
jgi:endonuclease/exonuclease/phosphatase family metal-dependent hydrolase